MEEWSQMASAGSQGGVRMGNIGAKNLNNCLETGVSRC